MRRADLISAAVFVVLGLVTIFVAVPRYVARTAADGELSSAFMPYVAASLLTPAPVRSHCMTMRCWLVPTAW